MVENPLSTIFGFIGTFYGLVVPLSVMLLVTLLMFAGMANPGAKARSVGEAVYCYLMHGVGVLLMTIGALPTVFSVFSGVSYTSRTYVALLLVFACGGVLFLVHDQMAHAIDRASKAVIEAVYLFSLKLIGNLIVVFSAISMLLHVVLGSFEAGWWVSPLVLLLYGFLLCWCTRGQHDFHVFHGGKPVMAAPSRVAKKVVARRK